MQHLERESKAGSELLVTILNDMSSLENICSGKEKQTNYYRALMAQLNKSTNCFQNESLTLRFGAGFLEIFVQDSAIFELGRMAPRLTKTIRPNSDLSAEFLFA